MNSQNMSPLPAAQSPFSSAGGAVGVVSMEQTTPTRATARSRERSRERSVTFQGLESDESEVTEQETAQTRSFPTHTATSMSRFSQRFRHSVLSGRSLWRFPSTLGDMPRYMQRKFRMKTFSLMAFQLLVVLGLAVLIDFQNFWDVMRPSMGATPSQVMFYFIGALNFISIMALQTFKDRYPCNYALLAVTTLMSGAFWGLTRGVTDFTIHFQILAILSFTMCSATVVSGILTNLETKISGMHILMLSLMPAWLIASVINANLSFLIFHLDPLEIAGSTGFSFVLILILVVDVGKLLERCHPDDFMAVIVSMNSTLMVVVSIPFFVLTFCFLHSGEAMMHQGSGQPNEVSVSGLSAVEVPGANGAVLPVTQGPMGP